MTYIYKHDWQKQIPLPPRGAVRFICKESVYNGGFISRKLSSYAGLRFAEFGVIAWEYSRIFYRDGTNKQFKWQPCAFRITKYFFDKMIKENGYVDIKKGDKYGLPLLDGVPVSSVREVL